MFGKKRQQGPDAKAQMRPITPEVEALEGQGNIEGQRNYMERMLTDWIQSRDRYTTMSDFDERISGFLKRVSNAGSLDDLRKVNLEFNSFAEKANRLIKK